MKKYLIILIALFITSCNIGGEETVKVSNTLRVVTTPLIDIKYPEFKSGDSVIIWRGNTSDKWHIETLNDVVYNSSNYISYKGVIVK